MAKDKARAIARTLQKSGVPISDYESGPDAGPCLVQQSEKVVASVACCHSYSTSTCVSPTSTCVSPIAANVAKASSPAQAVNLSGMAVTGVMLNTSAACARRAASMLTWLSVSHDGRCRPLCAVVVNVSDTIKLAQA